MHTMNFQHTLCANFNGTYTVGGVGRSNENTKCITEVFLENIF